MLCIDEGEPYYDQIAAAINVSVSLAPEESGEVESLSPPRKPWIPRNRGIVMEEDPPSCEQCTRCSIR